MRVPFRRLFEVDTGAEKDLRHFMRGLKLYIADVGSSGGPGFRWRKCSAFCHFVTFDLDPRVSTAASTFRTTNFPIGLWSGDATRTLFLTEFQAASSVFELNNPVLGDYLNSSAHVITGSQSVDLQSMEGVLPDELAPDFIKVDAEGADLEILRGAARFLKSTTLGLQVEVPFIPRHVDAPSFCDIDPFVRQRGFALFALVREHWVRSNGRVALTSRPQIAWADATYFLGWAELSKRIRHADPDTRDRVFRKLITLLLVHQVHDYAAEVVTRCDAAGLVSSACAREATELIRRCMPHPVVVATKLAIAIVCAFVALMVLYPFVSLRRRSRSMLKLQVKRLAVTLLTACRDGPGGACISDHI